MASDLKRDEAPIGRIQAGRFVGEFAALALSLSFIALCAFLFMLAPTDYRTPVLFPLLLIYLIGRLIWISFSPSSAPSLLILHWFTLFGAMIPLYFQYQGNSFHYPFLTSPNFDVTGPVTIVWLFVLFVDTGHGLATAWARRRAAPAEYVAHDAAVGLIRPSVFALVVLALIAAGVSSVGLEYFLASRLEQFLEYGTSALNFFMFTITLRLAVYWLFILSALLTWRALKTSGPFTLLFVGLAVLTGLATAELLVFSNPLGTARFLVMGFLLMMVAAFAPIDRPWMRLAIIVAAAFGLYVVFPVLGSAPRANEVVWVLGAEQLRSYLSHLDFDNAPQLMLGFQYAADQGFHYGWNILSAILILLPRSIWPGKSEGLGSMIISSYGVEFTNVSAPIYLEFYLDFGYPGVAVFSLLFGLLLGWANSLSRRHGRFSAAWMLNIALFAAMPIIVRGALTTGFVLMYAHLVVIAAFAMTRPVVRLVRLLSPQGRARAR